jgi:hypothetical protein
VAYPDRAPYSALEFAPEDFKAISNELPYKGSLGLARLGRAVIMLLLLAKAGTFLFHHEMPRTNSPLLTLTVEGKTAQILISFQFPYGRRCAWRVNSIIGLKPTRLFCRGSSTY